MSGVTVSQEALRKTARTKASVTAIIVLFLFMGSVYRTGANIPDLVSGLPEMGNLLADMVPPDWSYFPRIVQRLVETVQMAILGTTFGAVLAVPVALLAAHNVARLWFLVYPARFVLNLIRTIPDLLFAAIFSAIFGLGNIAGTLALSFFSFGLVAKLLYESTEAIDEGPLEAMTAVGANKVQWIHFAVVPQILAPFTAFTLYTLEINIRAAAVLGFVGAGGIGVPLDQTLGLLQYRRTSVVIISTLVIVIIIDYISTRLREKLL